jgi:hypothetical protein
MPHQAVAATSFSSICQHHQHDAKALNERVLLGFLRLCCINQLDKQSDCRAGVGFRDE